MGKVARILLIITMILAFVLIVVGFIMFGVITSGTTNETLRTMIERFLINNGLLDESGNSTLFGTTGGVEAAISTLASLALSFGFLGLPYGIAAIRAIRYSTKGRLIGVLICSFISFNPIFIVVAILNLVCCIRDGAYYYD